jgi:hypothetical protein
VSVHDPRAERIYIAAPTYRDAERLAQWHGWTRNQIVVFTDPTSMHGIHQKTVYVPIVPQTTPVFAEMIDYLLAAQCQLVWEKV